MSQGHLMPKSAPAHFNTVTHTNISTQYRHYTMLTYLAISIPWSPRAQVQHNNADGCKKMPGELSCRDRGCLVPRTQCSTQPLMDSSWHLPLGSQRRIETRACSP